MEQYTDTIEPILTLLTTVSRGTRIKIENENKHKNNLDIYIIGLFGIEVYPIVILGELFFWRIYLDWNIPYFN